MSTWLRTLTSEGLGRRAKVTAVTSAVLLAETPAVAERNAKAAEQLQRPGLRVHCTKTIMSTTDEKAELARQVMSLVSTESAAHAGLDRS